MERRRRRRAAGAAGMHVGGTTRGIFPARTGRSGAAPARRRRCIQTAAARPASPLPAAGSASKAQSRYVIFLSNRQIRRFVKDQKVKARSSQYCALIG